MAENFLTREVAGLPVGAWAAVVAGGLGLAYMLNKNQANAALEPVVEPGVGTGLVPAGAAFPATGQESEDAEPDNNLQWSQRAKAFLVARGIDPTKADNAVRKYVAAEQLTFEENAMINLAILGVGAPPEDLPPAPEPTEPGQEAQLDPQLNVTGPSSVKRGGKVTFTGRAYYQNTNVPQGPRLVKVVVWNWRFRVGLVSTSRFFVQTDDSGNFTASPGWTNIPRGESRYYTFHWEGTKKLRRVRIT